MTFKPAVWFPISVGLSILNVVSIWFAAAPAHAATHAVLAVAFALWAQRLRQQAPAGDRDLQSGLEALELEVGALRQELGEAQERLDFVERVLAQGAAEPKRVDPNRPTY